MVSFDSRLATITLIPVSFVKSSKRPSGTYSVQVYKYTVSFAGACAFVASDLASLSLQAVNVAATKPAVSKPANFFIFVCSP